MRTILYNSGVESGGCEIAGGSLMGLRWGVVQCFFWQYERRESV